MDDVLASKSSAGAGHTANVQGLHRIEPGEGPRVGFMTTTTPPRQAPAPGIERIPGRPSERRTERPDERSSSTSPTATCGTSSLMAANYTAATVGGQTVYDLQAD